MSEPTGRGYKTLAVKLPNEEHAQLVLIAALEDLSLNDSLLLAVRLLIAHKREAGDLAAQAAKALAEMEQEAAMKRAALQALMGPATDAGQPTLDGDAEAASTKGRPRRTT